jgi:hypothetical protein
MTLHFMEAGDTIEEIATGRRGQLSSVESINPVAHRGGTPVPIKWHVHFSDGEEPEFQVFGNHGDLRLVRRRPQ